MRETSYPLLTGRAVILGVFLLMPLTLLGESIPGSSGGLDTVWIAYFMAVALALAMMRGTPRAGLSRAAPQMLLVLFSLVSLLWTTSVRNGAMVFGTLLVMPLGYLAASDTAPGHLPVTIRRMAQIWIGVLGACFLLLGGPPSIGTPLLPALHLIGSITFSNRLFGIALVTLFILSTLGKPTRRRVLLVGSITLAFAIASGSRTASFVLGLLIITSPGLRLSWKSRLSWVTVTIVLVASALTIPSIRDRWFVNDEGSLTDIVTLSPSLETSGRRELWSPLLATCNERWLLGWGLGASNQLSREYSDGRISQPHNEFIRIYCDLGVVGSALFWGPILAMGIRARRSLRQDPYPALPIAAFQFIAAVLLLSVTDNVLSAPIQLTVPAFVLFGWSDALGLLSRGKVVAPPTSHLVEAPDHHPSFRRRVQPSDPEAP